jgi:outer membrane protein assembly factor BamB
MVPALLLGAAACTPQVHGWGGAAAGTGAVYTVGGNQKVLAFNPAARARGDAFPAQGEWQYPPESDRRAGTSFTAPVVANGSVYVAIHQLGGTPGTPGALLALDAGNGSQRWRFDLPSATGQLVGPPVVVNNTIYLGASDYVVYALDANTGATRWQFATRNKVWAGVAADSSGTAYIASLDHRVYAVDAATGKEQWRFETGGAIASAPLYADGRLYVGSADGYLYALDVQARGRGEAFPTAREWRVDSGSWFWATPLLDKGTLYAGTVDGGVFALAAATGEELWKTHVGSQDAVISATPILSGGLLALSTKDGADSQDGRVYALDAATGQERWRYSTDPRGPIYGGLSTDGTLLYAYSMNQRLIALDAGNGAARWTCRTEQPCKD